MMTNLAELPPDPAETKRVVLLNGPPRCGKDTAALGLANSLRGICTPILHKFAEPLAAAVRGMFGITQSRWDYLYTTAKEVPTGELLGMSPREAMIWVSEDVMKPKFGDEVFGTLAAEKISKMNRGVVVISDCGFDAEILPVADVVGWGSILILSIYRPGCTYAKDSRSYITPDTLARAARAAHDARHKRPSGPNLEHIPYEEPAFSEVVNRKDIFVFRDAVTDIVTRWLTE